MAVSTVSACRERFPIFERLVYINSCSQGALSDSVRAAYEEYLVGWDERGSVAEAKLTVLLQALKGEPFEHEGRRVQVTPRPPHPIQISWGGGTKPAARRAGRHGLGFFAESDADGLLEAYEAEARKHGHEPGQAVLSAPGTPTRPARRGSVRPSVGARAPYAGRPDARSSRRPR